MLPTYLGKNFAVYCYVSPPFQLKGLLQPTYLNASYYIIQLSEPFNG